MIDRTAKFYLKTKDDDLDNSFLENYVYKYVYYETKEKAIENLELNGSEMILDVGCGQGHFLKLVCDKHSNAEAVGIDLNLQDLKRARQRNVKKRCDFVLCNGAFLPFKDICFDKVACLAVLEHVDDERRVLNEIWRVLKNGQLAVLDIPGKYHLKNKFSDFTVKKLKLAPFHREYSFNEIQSIICETGFKLQSFNTARFVGSLLFPVIETVYVSKSRKIVWCRGFLATLVSKIEDRMTQLFGNMKYLKSFGGTWFLKIQKFQSKVEIS